MRTLRTAKIKDCHYDPCGLDEHMQPLYDENGSEG